MLNDRFLIGNAENSTIVQTDYGGFISGWWASVSRDEAPLLEDCDGLLGMQYFGNTVMVLDFERELMWVKSS